MTSTSFTPTSTVLFNTTTTTDVDENTCDLNDWRKITLMTCFSIVLLVGIVGNIYLLKAFGRRAKKGHRFELLAIYLATCDLVASIVSPTLFLYWQATCNQRWDFGVVGCKVIPPLSRITIDISIGVVLTMAIDRCLAVVRPRHRLTRNHLHWCVVATVVLSVVWEAYIINVRTVEDGRCIIPNTIQPDYAYPLIIMTTLRDVLFIVIFTTSTLLIFRTLERSRKKFRGSVHHTIRQSRIKRTKVLVVIAVVFSLLVLPRDIFHVTFTISWMDWPERNGIEATRFILDLNETLKLLQVSNSCVNVFIYGSMLGNIKKYRTKIYKMDQERRDTLNSESRSASLWTIADMKLGALKRFANGKI